MTENNTTPPSTRSRARKIVAGTAVLVVGGGAAFAYWTATGTGSGTATTGTVSGVIVNQTSAITGLAPGGTPEGLSGNFDNSNDAAVALTTVTGSVTATSATGCLASWYSVTGTGTVVGGSVPTGTGVGEWNGLSVALVNDPAVNQDACKNATVTITYAAS